MNKVPSIEWGMVIMRRTRINPAVLGFVCALGGSMLWVCGGFAELTQVEEGSPVTISIQHPDPAHDKPYTGLTVPVKGAVTSEAPIETLVVNGAAIELPEPTDGEATANGKYSVMFDRAVPIEPGTNVIDVAARDTAGHGARKRVVIKGSTDRELPDNLKAGIVVMAPEDDATSSRVELSLTSAILYLNRFNVLDREQIAKVLQESELSMSDFEGSSSALKIGRIAPAAYALRLGQSPRAEGLAVSASMISTQTGKIIMSGDEIIANVDSIEQMDTAMKELASRIVEAFPRVAGVVMRDSGTDFVVNFGAGEGIVPGTYVIVYAREDPVVDAVTGEVLMEGVRIPIARGIVTRVTATSSQCSRIRTEGDVERIEPGMPAMTW